MIKHKQQNKGLCNVELFFLQRDRGRRHSWICELSPHLYADLAVTSADKEHGWYSLHVQDNKRRNSNEDEFTLQGSRNYYAQRSCGLPIPGGLQSQFGWGPGQPDVALDMEVGA